MSKQNVELHRRVVEALNVRDVEALIALCDPNAELHSALAAVGGAVYHGHDGLRTWQREIEDAFEAIRAEPEEFFVKVYARREDALRDLGVSKDALEPIAP